MVPTFLMRKGRQGQIVSYLKGQSNEIFDPQFFSSFKLAWATDQWVAQAFTGTVS